MPKLPIRLLTRGLPALLVFAMIVAVPAAHGQAKKSDSVVKVAAVAAKPDATGVQTVTLTLEVESGWYIYANPIGNKDLESTQTTVKFAAAKPVDVVELAYPKGKEKEDKVVGDYAIYEGKVTVTARVKRTAGDTSPLEARVFLQSCSSRGCLLPATVKVPIQ